MIVVWKRIRDWAKRKHRDAYLNRYLVDLKCPHCNTWSSDCENEPEHSACNHPVATQYKCGQCGKTSLWVCEGGFWFGAEEVGIKVEEQPHE